MPTAVADHLSCLCHMVRDGRIPMAEVHRIIKRYSKTESELQKTFDRVLSSAREAAKEISDQSLKANAMVVIAGFSGDERDMIVALDSVAKFENGSKSQMLAVLVKALVDAGFIERAWEIVDETDDAYWRTEAILFIACQTKEPEHFEDAKASASHINTKRLREEALADIDYALVHKVNRRMPSIKSQQEKTDAVRDLVHAMVHLNDFDLAHEAALKVRSAHWRVNVLAMLNKALAELIKR